MPNAGIGYLLGDGPPLALIAVEKPSGGIAANRRGELSAQVYRIAKTEVQALISEEKAAWLSVRPRTAATNGLINSVVE